MIKQLIDAYYNENYTVSDTTPQMYKTDLSTILSDTTVTPAVTTVSVPPVTTASTTETNLETSILE
jgi:hypothetical protein